MTTRTISEEKLKALRSGYRMHEQTDKYLKRAFLKRWKIASQEIFDSGNSSWSMILHEFMENIIDELDDNKWYIEKLEKENKEIKEKLDWKNWLRFLEEWNNDGI